MHIINWHTWLLTVINYTLNLRNYEESLQTPTEFFSALGNPNLLCISVEDVAFANTHANWHKEPFASYSLNCDPLEIEENSDFTITVFPNPAKDQITIKNPINKMLEGEIFDFTGKKVKTVNCNLPETTIDIMELREGIYLLKIGDLVFRFVKS